MIAALLALSLTLSAQEDHAERTLSVGGGKIEFTLPDEHMAVSDAELTAWIKTAAEAVSGFYGRYPVPQVRLKVRTGRGNGVRQGMTYPAQGGLILITVGRDTPTEELKNDWMLPHEMIHLAFPSMADKHHWIEEGLSVYVEPVARAKAGQIPVAEVWRQFIRDMPKGQPEEDDSGLDNTPTWGRTYWGGAMFCLVGDVRIRERTKNRKGLQDALRAILDHGGTINEDWNIEAALQTGDKATGVDVLTQLYREMRDKPVTVDLDALWRKLGVRMNGQKVEFNDSAPEAAIRKAITAPARSSAKSK